MGGGKRAGAEPAVPAASNVPGEGLLLGTPAGRGGQAGGWVGEPFRAGSLMHGRAKSSVSKESFCLPLCRFCLKRTSPNDAARGVHPGTRSHHVPAERRQRTELLDGDILRWWEAIFKALASRASAVLPPPTKKCSSRLEGAQEGGWAGGGSPSKATRPSPPLGKATRSGSLGVLFLPRLALWQGAPHHSSEYQQSPAASEPWSLSSSTLASSSSSCNPASEP